MVTAATFSKGYIDTALPIAHTASMRLGHDRSERCFGRGRDRNLSNTFVPTPAEAWVPTRALWSSFGPDQIPGPAKDSHPGSG
eukprot:181025-Amphidinium_carterae.1